MKNNKSKLAKFTACLVDCRSENGGFTIETLVAVTILSAAIAGPMVLLH